MKQSNYFLFAALLLISCEKEIEVKTPEYEKQIVITSYTGTGDIITAEISRSIDIKDYNGQQALGVANAMPRLYVNGTYIETLQNAPLQGIYNNNMFVSTTKAVAGNSYKIVVSAPGFTDAEGTSEAPVAVPVISWNRRPGARIQQWGAVQDEISFTFSDPVSKGDYYWVELLHAAMRDTTDTIPRNNHWNVGCINTNDPAVAHLSSFDFSNEDCIASNELYLEDELFNGTTKEFKFYIDSTWLSPYENVNGDKYYPAIRLHHISSAYFRHLRSYRYAIDNNGNPFSEPVNVYSNVKNGLGVFSIGSIYTQELK